MTITEIAKWFADKDDIAVISHVSPDGDAVGSALTVKQAFERLGKRACVVLADPVPRKYRFLPGAEDVYAPDCLPFEPKCAFAVDVSEMRRMGSALEIFVRAPYKACLDHHETNAGYGDVWHVEGDRASTGEMALEFVKALGVEPDENIASTAFVAVATDTGNFNYKNTDARAFNAAAACVNYGAQVEPLTKKVYRERSLSCTLLLGEALMRVKTAADGRIAYTYVDNAMLEKTGARLEDASRIANYLNEVAGVEVGVYFEEQSDNTKISWRAAGNLNVAEIAKCFGGGGHDAAAGANLKMTMEEAMAAVLARTEEAVKGSEA